MINWTTIQLLLTPILTLALTNDQHSLSLKNTVWTETDWYGLEPIPAWQINAHLLQTIRI